MRDKLYLMNSSMSDFFGTRNLRRSVKMRNTELNNCLLAIDVHGADRFIVFGNAGNVRI